MEFKLGQKYRIKDASLMWDSCMYTIDGDYYETHDNSISYFESGDIVSVKIGLNGAPCFVNEGYSQGCRTFTDSGFNKNWEIDNPNIFELIEDDAPSISISNCPVFCKTHPKATKPTKKTKDGGYDLYSVFDKPVVVQKPHEVMMFNTGIKVAFDTNYVALFRERGSTGIRNMHIRAGVVEGNFRGNYKILLSNGNGYLDIIYVENNWKWQEMLFALNEAYPHYGWNEVNIENLEIVKDDLGREILVDKTQTFECLESIHHVAYIYPQSKAIAQMVIVKKEDWEFEEVSEEYFDTLITERGDGMLGSSGA